LGKTIYIIAGCNGAGKTTASFTILPDIIDCKEFVNADEIAKGLSPFHPENVAIESGRIMLHRINELIEHEQDFAFETTLSTKSYRQKLVSAKKLGYQVCLLFLWLNSSDLAIERVGIRVLEGGHNIDNEVIKRRYVRGIRNLFEIYLPIADNALIFDNSFGIPELVYQKNFDQELILNAFKFDEIRKSK
jgi:predicted ABC-type ATPase